MPNEQRTANLGGRPLPATPAACEKNRPKQLSVPKEQEQRKASASVIQGEAPVPSQEIKRTWRPQPHGSPSSSGFTVKDTEVGAWGIFLQG